jgi:hypothetical protein
VLPLRFRAIVWSLTRILVRPTGRALDSAHAHRPGAPVNSQYVYDTKYKQNAYGSLLSIYSYLFGTEDGASNTAANLGPLDDAYVDKGS